MKSKRNCLRTLGWAAGLLLIVVNGVIAYNAIQNLIANEAWLVHTYQVLREIETDVSLAKDVETGTRGYIITAQKEFLEPYNEAKYKVQTKLEPLYTMTRDNSPQQKRVLELADLIDRKLQIARKQIQLVDAGQSPEARRFTATGVGKDAMDAVRAKAGEMRAEEERLLKIRARQTRQAGRNARTTFVVAGIGSLLLFGLVYYGMAQAYAQKEELEAAYSEVKRLEEMRDNLTAMLVHDLRTPLTAMLGPLEMLKTGKFGMMTDMQQELVGMSLMGSQRLLGLVNELLDISKMEAGELKLRFETLDPPVVIEDAVKAVTLAQFGNGPRIERETPSKMPILQADQELLTRVLINLLGNAVKFTPASGTVTLGVNECVPARVLPERLQALAEEYRERALTPSLLFCVQDTGEGIPASELDRVFDKFGQVETRKQGRKMSTGLGLTFCRMVIEAHGGFIWVESTVGEGATFYFTVPLRLPTPDAAQTNQAEAAAAVS